jgi:hypothetical protein
MAQGGEPQPDANVIVARMMAAIQQCKSRGRSLTVRRDYQLFDKKWESKAQVVVRVTFVPPDQKRYDVESSRGGVGERILRDILAREMETPNATGQKWLTPDNYNFRLLGRETIDGHPCYVLALAPKREERNVIRGRAWIDMESYRLRRLEGEPVKVPSWWIHDLYFSMNFDEVDGMWMRTLTQAIANVRLRGKYVMVARNVDSSPRPSESSLPPGLDLNGAAVIPP